MTSATKMAVTWVAVEDLRDAAFNPQRRTQSISDLVAAIERSEFIRPLDVTTAMTIIDGHRRLAAAKRLGWEKVPVIIHQPEQANVLYAALNSAVMRPSGNDNLSVYMMEPDAVASGARRGMARMEEMLGRDLLQELADRGGSQATFKQSIQVADYCGVKDSPDWIRSITRWLLETRQTYQVRRSMEDGIEPKALLRAIETMRSLKRGWSAE